MMVRIQYDAYNRYFKILDHELDRLFEDGDVFLLVISDSEKDPGIDWTTLCPVTVAHA